MQNWRKTSVAAAFIAALTWGILLGYIGRVIEVSLT